MSKPTGNAVVVVVVLVCERSKTFKRAYLVQLWGFLELLMLMMLLLYMLLLLLALNQTNWHLIKKHKSPCFETEPVSHNANYATPPPPSPSSSSRLLANDSLSVGAKQTVNKNVSKGEDATQRKSHRHAKNKRKKNKETKGPATASSTSQLGQCA
jgi:hypothetical protein